MSALPAAKSPLMLALEQIEREKGVKADDILEMIKGAIKSALQKHLGKDADIRVEIDPQTAAITAAQVKKVVEEITIPDQEMTVEQAQKYKKGAGEEVVFPINDMDLFARIAAQTAKQVLTQKVREVERDNLYEEFKPKEGEIISGAVHRFMDRNIILDLGKTEAIMPLREQIRRERYGAGERVRAVILKVDKAQRGPQVLVSRASPLFLRRLFEMEVPEINEKIVEIVEIVRDPGFRAKVLVRSNNPKVDAVGACIGIRGSRIRSIMNEVSGERIDLVPFTDEAAAFISASLTPAKTSSVKLVDKENRRAEVIVANDQLSLAIGKDGQNVRLASKLTGWNIEVKSESQKVEEVETKEAGQLADLGQLDGVGPKVAEVLVKGGMADIYKLATLTAEDLMTLQGVGEKTAQKIIASAQKWAAEHPRAEGAPAEAAPVEEPAPEQPAVEPPAEGDKPAE